MLGRVVVVAGLCALGCVDDGNPAANWCGGLCMALARCGDVRPYEKCRSDCVVQRPGLANRSAEGAAAEAPCLAMLSCATFFDEATWDTELDACWDQAVLSVEVTAPVRAFCADYARAWFECGYSSSVDGCEHVFGMWAMSVLDRLVPCADAATCDGLRACQTSVFENL